MRLRVHAACVPVAIIRNCNLKWSSCQPGAVWTWMKTARARILIDSHRWIVYRVVIPFVCERRVRRVCVWAYKGLMFWLIENAVRTYVWRATIKILKNIVSHSLSLDEPTNSVLRFCRIAPRCQPRWLPNFEQPTGRTRRTRKRRNHCHAVYEYTCNADVVLVNAVHGRLTRKQANERTERTQKSKYDNLLFYFGRRRWHTETRKQCQM